MTGGGDFTRRRRQPGDVFADCVIVVLIAVGLLFSGTDTVRAQIPPEAPDVEVIAERMLFTRGPGGPRVLHMVQLVNIGPRVAEQVPLAAPLGAVWLDVPEQLSAQQDVLIDPRPMAAGEARQYVFTYELPWQRLPMAIRRPLLYPTGVLELWAETDALTLRGVNVRPDAMEEIGGIHFTVYVSTDLQPHPQWQVVLETTTGPGARASPLERIGQRSDPLDIVRNHPLPGLLLLAVVLLAVGLIIARRINVRTSAGAMKVTVSPETAQPSAPSGGGRVSTSGEVARLKEAIVQVDVAFQNGDVDEDVYVERRRALKSQLLQLMRGQRGAGERSS